MTTPATTGPSAPSSEPSTSTATPARRAAAEKPAPGVATAAARELAEKTKADAAAAAQAKTNADSAALKAQRDADAAKLREEDLKRLDAARRHLRKATPDDPVPLRRLETASPVGDTLYGTARNVIDLRNSEYANRVTLLFDGQVVHVINGSDPGKSFWVGYANIAAMYPRFDI